MAKKIKLRGEIQSNTSAVTEENKVIFNQEGELVVDVFETNTDFVVLAAIAGTNIKDLDISVEKEMMVIKGNRPDPHDIPEKKYLYRKSIGRNGQRNAYGYHS